jgi:uncharacterized iron-regulated protein
MSAGTITGQYPLQWQEKTMSRYRLFICIPCALLLCIASSCAVVGKKSIGNPQDPYPLKSPPLIGQIVHLPTGTLVSPDSMMAIAGDSRITYVGETHDNPASHRLEFQVLHALSERYPGRLALGMEMFVLSQQPILDRWVAGELDEKTFLKQSQWFDNWNMDFAYYREILNFARDRHIPVIALNAEKALVKAIRSKELAQLSAAEKLQLPDLDFSDPYHRALVEAIFGDNSHARLFKEQFISAQVVRDETMAESVAHYLKSPAGENRHMVVIAGGDHVSSGFGIPRRVFRRLALSYTIIGGMEINIPPEKEDRTMNVTIPGFPMVPYDFLVYQSYEDLPATGVRLGVMIDMEPTGRGPLVKSVVPSSNAERAGLLAGDLLVSLDGQVLKDTFDLTYAVQQKHPGDHSVLQIERNGKPMKVEIDFQATQKGHQHGKK